MPISTNSYLAGKETHLTPKGDTMKQYPRTVYKTKENILKVHSEKEEYEAGLKGYENHWMDKVNQAQKGTEKEILRAAPIDPEKAEEDRQAEIAKAQADKQAELDDKQAELDRVAKELDIRAQEIKKAQDEIDKLKKGLEKKKKVTKKKGE